MASIPIATPTSTTQPPVTAEWTRFRPPLRGLLRKRLADLLLPWLEQAHREGGDFVRTRIGPLNFYIVSDPEWIEHVLVRNWRNYSRGEPEWSYVRRGIGNGLVTSDGELHEQQRKLIQPVFQARRVAGFGGIVNDATDRIEKSWRARSGEVVDVSTDMMRLTMLAIARVLFGLDLEEEAERVAGAVTDLNGATTSFDLSLSGYLYFMPTRTNRRFRRSIRYLDGLMARLTEVQRQRGREDNVLSMLIEAQSDGSAPGLDDRLLRDELVTLFGAGHETTSNMLSWTWLLLAQNPDAEARLHAELDDVLGGRPATVEDLPRLEYTDRVIKESMRIYPPVWGNQRVSIGEDNIAGRALPAGSMVAPLPWLVHRDERWYPDPLRFDPDRFEPDAVKARPRFSYFPFGGGDRVCVGQAFAEMEGRLALATLAQQFTPRLLPGQTVVPEALVSMRPKGGLAMRMVART